MPDRENGFKTPGTARPLAGPNARGDHAMYPLKTIIDFLLSGVGRIAANERADALCTLFAGLLPEMSEPEIATAREQVICRFWASPEVSDGVVDLIDGHVALRKILAEPLQPGTTRSPFGEGSTGSSQ